jgi:tetratricopeptide (TPR) repeat protein
METINMSEINISARIAQAWAYHRAERNNDAQREFEAILHNAPDDIDALYGMGLTLRAAGQKDEAIELFQKAYDLTQDALHNEVQDVETNQGLVEDTLVVAGQNPRYMMLTRMLRQRLAELGAAPKSS